MSVGGVLYELWWEILKISPNFPTNSKVKVSHACLWSYLWWATSEKWIIIIIAAPLYYNYHSTWGLHGGTVVGALASQWEDPGSNPALHLPVCQLGPKWPGNGSFEGGSAMSRRVATMQLQEEFSKNLLWTTVSCFQGSPKTECMHSFCCLSSFYEFQLDWTDW